MSVRTGVGHIAAAAVCFTLGHAAASAETMDELYEKAKAEKSLVIYAGGPVAGYEPLARDFEKKFPGLTVSITGGFSNVLNDKIEQQFKAGKLETDLVLFQTAQDFVRWKGQGRLLSFRPDGTDAIPATSRDADSTFISWRISAIGYAYNTQYVKPENVPKSALDFLKPEFMGKMIACYPFDDDATLYLFYTLMQKYGEDYVDKYLANKPNWVQGHLGVARSIADGTNYVSLDSTHAITLALKKAGQPIELVFPDTDLVPVFPVTAGIFKDAPHPNFAKLYLTWLMQPEQQERAGPYSPRPDVVPQASSGLKPLADMKLANNYRDFVTDENLLNRLRKKFETAIGPIKNAGGVR
jgi:ABC-type Fe3+ transport system substrate-binding protein